MLLDNFGSILLQVLSNGIQSRPVKNVGASSFNTALKNPATTGSWANNSAGKVRLGSGSTPPARSNFAIETPLLTSPESAYITYTNPMGYGSGICSMLSNVGPFGAAETVRESILTNSFNVDGASSTIFDVAMARYVYTPLLVAIGETVVVETTINV